MRNDGFLYQVGCLLDAFLAQSNKNLKDYENLKRNIRQCAKSTSAFLRKEKQNIAMKYQQQLQKCMLYDASDNTSISQLFSDMTSEMMQYSQTLSKGKLLSREDSFNTVSLHFIDLTLSLTELYENLYTNRRRQLKDYKKIEASFIYDRKILQEFFIDNKYN